MRQYTFDINNKYTGFIDSDTFIQSSTAVAPETPEHKLWNATTNVWDLLPPVTVTLEIAKANKINEARDYYNEIIVGFQSDSAEFEIETWETQRSEWVRFIGDPLSLTPYCDMLATTRGITRELVMEKIGIKVTSIAQVQGTLHKIEDQISACTTIEAVDLIGW